jgi:ABC-2 type transport system ATP-binding protein
MSDICLELDAVVRRYPRFTLGPVSFTVPRGSITGLVGPNGAGKSTLMESIFGVDGLDAGRIRVRGFDHERDELEVKRRTGYAGPELMFLHWGKVERAMRFVRGLHPDWDDALAERLMADWELEPGMKIATLSHGQRTKLALLLAMAWRPRLLVLDEPTTGLDPRARQILFRELLEFVSDGERSVLVSSHELAGLERHADRVIVLHQGRLLAEGATDELLWHFQRVSFDLAEGERMPRAPWFWLEATDGRRVRGMIDQRMGAPETLPAETGSLERQALTLEEWFLILTGIGGRES